MTARYCDRCGALPRGVGGSHGCPTGCPGRDPWQRIADRLEHIEFLVTRAIHAQEHRG